MNILFIHCTYKVKGGEDTVVQEEAALLRSLGYTTDVLLFNNDKNALLSFIQLPFNISSFIKTNKKIKQFKPDIVHVHNLHFAASASVLYAVRKNKIPFVITLHNYRLICPSAILYFRHQPFLDSLRQNFPWSAIEKKVYRNSFIMTFWLSFSNQLHKWLGTWNLCSSFIVLSEDAQRIFLNSNMRHIAERIIIKPNFCVEPAPNNSKPKNYFLYVGRLCEEKGVMLLLKAFSNTSHELKIAGDGELKTLVEEYASKYSNIKFLGKLHKEAVYHYMQTCTALLFPSLWLEGMPLTIIEAFACKTAVITSEIGAMRFMIEDEYNGLFFTSGSEDDLLDKINKWQTLTDFEQNNFRKNAYSTYLKNYTPSKNAKLLLNIYEGVLDEQEVNKNLHEVYYNKLG